MAFGCDRTQKYSRDIDAAIEALEAEAARVDYRQPPSVQVDRASLGVVVYEDGELICFGKADGSAAEPEWMSSVPRSTANWICFGADRYGGFILLEPGAQELTELEESGADADYYENYSAK